MPRKRRLSHCIRGKTSQLQLCFRGWLHYKQQWKKKKITLGNKIFTFLHMKRGWRVACLCGIFLEHICSCVWDSDQSIPVLSLSEFKSHSLTVSSQNLRTILTSIRETHDTFCSLNCLNGMLHRKAGREAFAYTNAAASAPHIWFWLFMFAFEFSLKKEKRKEKKRERKKMFRQFVSQQFEVVWCYKKHVQPQPRSTGRQLNFGTLCIWGWFMWWKRCLNENTQLSLTRGRRI